MLDQVSGQSSAFDLVSQARHNSWRSNCEAINRHFRVQCLQATTQKTMDHFPSPSDEIQFAPPSETELGDKKIKV